MSWGRAAVLVFCRGGGKAELCRGAAWHLSFVVAVRLRSVGICGKVDLCVDLCCYASVPDGPARQCGCVFCDRLPQRSKPLPAECYASHRPIPLLEPCFEAIMRLEKARALYASGCKTLASPKSQTFSCAAEAGGVSAAVPLARCVSEVRPLRPPTNSSHRSSQDPLLVKQPC